MEPLAVLGLISNVVQLVDTSARAFNVCREIRAHGISKEDTRLSLTVNELYDSYKALTDSLPDSNPGNSVDLKRLASQCCKTAETLLTELDTLHKSPQGGFAETMSKAYRKWKTSKKVKRLKANLVENQKTLDSKLVLELRQQLKTFSERQQGRNDEVLSQLSQLSQQLASCHRSVADQVKADINEVIGANERQHVTTRDHVTTQVAKTAQDIRISHAKLIDEQNEEQQSKQQRERVIESLTYSENNSRMNAVSSSHPETFHWIFDNDVQSPWDSFTAWLNRDENIYWINGKAGSGKSTLMKFLTNDPRTSEMLARWSPQSKVLIVTYYFWLSGSILQRNLKGFLCSVVRQIVLGEDYPLSRLFQSKRDMLTKRSADDWSVDELKQTLREGLDLLTRPVCIFIDGLDEFDRNDDVDSILDLIEDYCTRGKVKFCVSSRPESYIEKRLSRCKRLRLQDLTKKDIETCTRNKLNQVRSKCLLSPFDDTNTDEIVKVMTLKADGVFLWVHYALNSLARGMQNDDRFDELLDRIDDLPGEMNQLYLQMWNRLNGDEQRYRDEAALYFQIVLQLYDNSPILRMLSLFEMLVVVERRLQNDYVRHVKIQDPVDLANRCERLKARVLTRCAGLLEPADIGGHEKTTHHKEITNDPNTALKDPLSLSQQRQSGEFTQVVKPLNVYHFMGIDFMHRTARDFVLGTESGQNLLGESKIFATSRCETIVKARMAAIIQGLTRFNGHSISNIIAFIGSSETDNQAQLLRAVRGICERLSKAGSPKHHINYRDFWNFGPGGDFESMAAFWGCAAYICHFTEDQESYVSPYYRGYLLLYAALSGMESPFSNGPLPLICWLAENGADMHSKHVSGTAVLSTASTLLMCIEEIIRRGQDQEIRQVSEFLEKISPLFINSLDESLVKIEITGDALGSSDAKVAALNFFPHDLFHQSRGEPFAFLALMSVSKLYLLVMKVLEHLQPQWISSQSALHKEDSTKILFYFDDNEKEDVGSCPNSEDSEFLGQIIDSLLLKQTLSGPFPEASYVELKSRFEEVRHRSPKASHKDWGRETGWLIDPSELSPYVLDPAEDVDSSNWRERGHFRRRDVAENTHDTKQNRDISAERAEEDPEQSSRHLGGEDDGHGNTQKKESE